MNNLVVIGIVLLFIAIILIFIGSIFKGDGKVEAAGIVFIGPIPLGFATNKKLLLPLLIFAVVVFVLWFLFRRFV